MPPPFTVLGSLHIATSDGVERPVPGALRRTLLALLLLHHDTSVSTDRLADALWGGRPPASPTTSLYNQVMRLRQSLGGYADRIRSAPPGYLIHIEPGELDHETFTELCVKGRQAADAGRWTEAGDAYTSALELWRGEPLADIPALHEHPIVQRLHEECLQALQGRVESELRLGRHETVVGELRILVKDHPLREEFHSQLMLALYRSGRQAEALDAYRVLRRVTVDELGVEPGPGVKRLQERILRSDPALAAPKAPDRAFTVERPSASSSVRQLPADMRIFAGRTSELDELLALASGQAEPGTVVISAINGMGGVGKTALAVRAAHRLRERFPDGQLFIDLHGYSADLDPVEPAEALEYLLRSLGEASARIPAGLEERVGRYRSLLAGTRTLIVLDNAVNAAQARPLLPAAPGCLVLITSRNTLSSLDDAHILALDVLPPADALALLRDVAGPERVRAEPAAAQLVELCGRIPLAVRIAGSRLRHRSALTVAALVAELRGEHGRLDLISDGERDLSGVVGSTLKVLPDEVRRTFRLLGLVPGPDFDAYAAAHLAATGLDAARRALETLLDHNLLIQHVPGRYRFHDLLRAHAVRLAEQDPGGRAAHARLLDFYIHTTLAADRFIGARQRPETADPLEIPEPTRTFPDRAQATAWLRQERANLLTAAHCPTDRARSTALINALTTQLHLEGPYDIASRLFEGVVEYAREQGDRLLEANALLELAYGKDILGLAAQGEPRAIQALEIYREIGNKPGEANTLYRLAHLNFVRCRYKQAVALADQALRLHRSIGHRHGIAHSLAFAGLLAHLESHNAAARAHYEEAIGLMREIGDVAGEANCLLIFGRVGQALGEFDAVIPTVEQSVSLFAQSGQAHGLSNALQELGRQHLLRGEFDEASQLLDRALTIQLEIGFRLGEGNVYWERGRIAFARGTLEAALELHERALLIFKSVGSIINEAMAWDEIARVQHARGDDAAAWVAVDKARVTHEQIDYVFGQAEVCNTRAALTADVEGAEAGLAAYTEALGLAERAEHPLERAHAMEGIGRCEVRLGRREAGLERLRAAVELYGRMHAREYGAAAAFLAEVEAEG